jgi:hypothetical protein
MEDQQIGRILRELPREQAGDHFTARVLAGLDAERQPRRARWVLATAAGLALLVSVALVGRQGWNGGPAGAEARQALEEIRDEHERLAHELERLQSLRQQPAQPEVIYLGGNEDMDLVVDLGRLAENGTLPASYGSGTF